MDLNDSPPSIDQLAEFVKQVETLMANARLALDSLSSPSDEQGAYETILDASIAHEQQIADIHAVFTVWEQEEISPYEKSEVTRAISLLTRANLVTQNTLRLVKKALGMPDPEREQAELQIQLQSMGVIRG